jgi:hypothetical protein
LQLCRALVQASPRSTRRSGLINIRPSPLAAASSIWAWYRVRERGLPGLAVARGNRVVQDSLVASGG